jgi:gliding motility-associated-like protein
MNLTITEPTELSSSIVSQTDQICAVSGSATVEGLNGTPSYTYIWPTTANGVTGGTATDLTIGTYEVTITDANLCSVIQPITIVDVGGLDATASVVSIPDCYGGNEGEIEITINTGTPDFTIAWDSGSDTNSSGNYTITGLNSGDYEITITDVNSCQAIVSANVTEPDPLVINEVIASHQNVDCYGNATGALEVSASDGTPGYLFSLDGGTAQASGSFNGLSAGTYALEVEDANGCLESINITITEPAELVLTEVMASHQDVDCFGNSTGILEVSASAGTPGYMYALDGGTAQASGSFTGLSTGTYVLEVEDANACLDTVHITINQPNELFLSIQSQSDLTCYGGNDGAVIMETTGGTPDYSYQWSDGYGTQANVSNFSVGTFELTLTDNNGCQATQSVTIGQPDEIVVNHTVTPVNCGNNAGSIELTVTGGNGGYTYDWDGSTSADSVINDLTAGIYSVDVFDSEGCSVTLSAEVEIVGGLSVMISEDESITCFGETNAVLTASSNGESPEQFSWSVGGNTTSISNLGAGNYVVSVTDAWGCFGSQSHEVVEPTQIQISLANHAVSCYGGSDGMAIPTASGGTPTYDFNWFDQNNGDTLLNVPAGNYQLEVTDSRGCMLIQNVSIGQPDSMLLVQVQSRNISCYGADDGQIVTEASGGTPPYYFLWTSDYGNSSNTSLVNLREGYYYLNLLDANGCAIDTSIDILEPSPILVDYIMTNPSCIGNNDGYIELEVVGGIEPYVYIWDMATASLPYFDGLYEGSYEIIVRDANGCENALETITLLDVPEECLRIPNAFTPNADDNNDTWIIENLDLFNKYRVQVFNRWGQMLYTGEPGSEPWDGTTTEGKPVPTGSYLYVVNLYNGSKPKTGVVTVVY